MRSQVGGEICCCRLQGFFTSRRKEKKLMRTPLAQPRLRLRFFQHHMHIGAADAEGTDACAPRNSMAFPSTQTRRDIEWAVREIDRGIRCSVVQRRRDGAMLEREHGLDQTGHAGCAGEMAKIGFNRAYPTKPATVGLLFEHLGQG